MVALRHVSGLLAVSCLVLACEGTECTAIGCAATHAASLEVASDAASTELTIEACFNDACDSAPAPEASAGVGLEPIAGKLWVSASSSTPKSDPVLSVSWHAAGSLPVREGDRYAVRVKTADGTVVAESVEIAETYSRSYPNGKDCDGDGCLHVDSVRRVP